MVVLRINLPEMDGFVEKAQILSGLIIFIDSDSGDFEEIREMLDRTIKSFENFKQPNLDQSPMNWTGLKHVNCS